MNLDDLNRELRAKHLAGFWAENIVEFGRDIEPRAGSQAHLWRRPDIYDGLMRARELVSLEQSERRTIRLMNPGIPGPTGVSTTAHLSVQLVKPGEVAKAHRHTSNVIYHAFRGAGRTFIGEQMLERREGDIFNVPLWSWHRDENSTAGEAVLFSINDRPAKAALGLYWEEAA